MRIRALVIRIWHQVFHDKRTLALMLVAPIAILTLISFVFNGSTYQPKIGLVGLPTTVVHHLADEGVKTYSYPSAGKAMAALKSQSIDAYVDLETGKRNEGWRIVLEGSSPSKNQAVLLDLQKLAQNLQRDAVQQVMHLVQANLAGQGHQAPGAAGTAGHPGQSQAAQPGHASQPAGQATQHGYKGQSAAHSGQAAQQANAAISKVLGQLGTTAPFQIQYLYGSSTMSSFDSLGPVLIGFFAFFFVFLVAGISFLKERTTGTLERLLASPIKRFEIVIGYVIGFGIFTTLQAVLIAWFSVDVLGMMMNGHLINLLVVTLLLSMTALTLGIFLSTFANSEFQMMQFIPLVIVPQFFFTGLFNIDTMASWLRWLGKIMPLYYGADAMQNVMIRGKGLGSITTDLAVLLGLSVAFMILNVITLRKYRKA